MSTQCPQLGIFWIHNQEVLKESLPWSKIQPEGGVRDLEHSHYEIWERKFKPIVNLEYEEVLRGRVLMDESGSYRIISSRFFKESDELIDLVTQSFFLQSVNKLYILTDSHYEYPPKGNLS